MRFLKERIAYFKRWESDNLKMKMVPPMVMFLYFYMAMAADAECDQRMSKQRAHEITKRLLSHVRAYLHIKGHPRPAATFLSLRISG